jgi:hypothetical protein
MYRIDAQCYKMIITRNNLAIYVCYFAKLCIEIKDKKDNFKGEKAGCVVILNHQF